MCNKPDLKSLKCKTEKYWDIAHDDSFKYDKYIENLLPDEIGYAKYDKKKRFPDQTCKRLVFLVGHSLEPLFQSIWVYEPEQILLILSKSYGEQDGGGMGKEVERLITEELSVKTKITPEYEVKCEVIENTSARAVFRKLLDEVKEDTTRNGGEPYPVVIDITGGKKSMVAGAFLFAAYTGVPISYVDFDDNAYNIERGKPYGYAFHIGIVGNPYKDFALRDWEQVRTLYTQHNFRGACQMLDDNVIPAMEEILSDKIDKVKRLKDVLECYELWDNGDFSRAKQKADTIRGELPNFQPPTAVKVLGKDKDYWPHGVDTKELLKQLENIEFGKDKDVKSSIYLSPQRLLTYAHDEVARVDRLIKFNEDYRSAFLKAVSLWEVLSRARVVGLWCEKELEISKNKTFSPLLTEDEIKEWDTAIYYGIICSNSGGYNEGALKYNPSGNKKARRKQLKITCRYDKDGKTLKKCSDGNETKPFYCRREKTAPLLGDVKEGDDIKVISMGELNELRNKAIHTYLSIPQDLAKEAYRIALNNLKDYEENWVSHIWPEFKTSPIEVEAISWSELCEICDLDFLPMNLQRDANLNKEKE